MSNIENTTYQSFSEVYDIIKHMPSELYNKIPKNFLNLIEQSRDKNYKFEIDYTKCLNQQKLLHETKVICSLIYRDYLCNPEEEQELLIQDNNELQRYNNNNLKTNNTESFFKKKRHLKKIKCYNINSKINKKLPIIVDKENIFKKIFKFLKRNIKISN